MLITRSVGTWSSRGGTRGGGENDEPVPVWARAVVAANVDQAASNRKVASCHANRERNIGNLLGPRSLASSRHRAADQARSIPGALQTRILASATRAVLRSN
jgi:hypothetical protein